MKKIDDDHLMMIEPVSAATDSIDDEITKKAKSVLELCTKGLSWRGVHRCFCGELSDNVDHITLNGLKTNSLLVHYVEFHRDEVPQSEIDKLLA